MDLGLTDKAAIVGGASSGLGLAIAERLSEEGANVVAVARRRQELEEGVGRLGATTIAADLSTPADQERVVEAAVERFGGIDVAVWNTGGPGPRLAAEIDPATFEDAFQSLYLPLVNFVGLVVPFLRQSEAGRLLAVTAAGAKEPTPNIALSNALRPGIVGYLKTLSNELAPDGITVNCVAPGRIFTPRFQQVYPEGPPPELVGDIPMGRFGTPDEFADAAVFLASSRARYITGTTLTVDGGLTKAIF